MGHRHNRKRTRSRPHRHSKIPAQHRATLQDQISSMPSYSPASGCDAWLMDLRSGGRSRSSTSSCISTISSRSDCSASLFQLPRPCSVARGSSHPNIEEREQNISWIQQGTEDEEGLEPVKDIVRFLFDGDTDFVDAPFDYD